MTYAVEMASDGMHIYFHHDWISHSSNIKVITSTIREVAVLVLLMGEFYEVHRSF
jgi:hypothetical protein